MCSPKDFRFRKLDRGSRVSWVASVDTRDEKNCGQSSSAGGVLDKPISQMGGSLATEYIGNKRSLLAFITSTVAARIGNGQRNICDLFSGTGVVSAAFKAMGHSVTANDHLATCFNLTAATLLNHAPPEFHGLPRHVTFNQGSSYSAVLAHLNNLTPEPGGFVHKNFSPFSKYFIGIERRYFTEVNAIQIDTIRNEIERWRRSLTPGEHALLLSDLVRSVGAVSNVAGTYGCYLKHWKSRARAPLVLRESQFVRGRIDGHRVLSLDATVAVAESNCSVVYADPPYTKRQYAAYYHVLETIVRNDQPMLTGSTGLRDWESHASDFCYKRRADTALEKILRAMDCEHFFLSYNDDGQMSHKRILELLGAFGRASYVETGLKRYKSSSRPHKGPVVTERLYHLAVA